MCFSSSLASYYITLPPPCGMLFVANSPCTSMSMLPPQPPSSSPSDLNSRALDIRSSSNNHMAKHKEMMTMRRTGSFPSQSSSSSSSSSSDFEFTVSLSPSSSNKPSTHLCPADELFYKGQILPLHLSPRITMLRTLLLASSSASSSSTDATTATTASRDSNGSSSSSSYASSAADLLFLLPDCDSSRPSSVTEDETRRVDVSSSSKRSGGGNYFASLANRLSSVFLNRSGSKKDAAPGPAASAKQVIKKYVGKVKPLYDKISQKKKKKALIKRERCIEEDRNSFSGNLRHSRRKRCAGSCPSSMRSSPTHSGLLRANRCGAVGPPAVVSSSSVEELQSAIQGAIAHCKSTMVSVAATDVEPISVVHVH